MEEISFAFRPYYKVELGMPERQAHHRRRAEVVGAGRSRRRRWPTSPRSSHEPDPPVDVAVDAPPSAEVPCRRAGAVRRRRARRRQRPPGPVRPLTPRRVIPAPGRTARPAPGRRGRSTAAAATPSAGEQEREQHAGAHPTHHGRASRSTTSLTSTPAAFRRDLSRGSLVTTLCADATARLAPPLVAAPAAPGGRRDAARVAAGSRSSWWSSCSGSRCSARRSSRCRT